MSDDASQSADLRLFEAAFEQEAMGMALRAVDPHNPRFLRVNKTFCEIVGYTRKELLKLTSIDITPPEERHYSVDYSEKLKRGDFSSYSREKRYLRKDGQEVWVNVWLSIVLGKDGTPAQIISCIQDISERKRSEIVRQEVENRFRSVADSSPAGITLKDREGRFQVVNRAYARWMNVSAAELIGKTAADFFPPRQAREILADDRKVIDTGMEATRETVRTFTEGVTRHVLTHKRPVYSADNQAIAVSTIITDITDRIRAEDTLRESELRFKDFAESASDWFWETDAEFAFTYLSDRFYEDTSFRSSDKTWTIRDQQVDAAASPLDDDRWLAHTANLDAHKPFKNIEYGLAAPDGTTHYVRVSGTPVVGSHGKFLGYRGTGTDITEAHRLSEQLSYQASHDSLTQLINRREFERRLERVLTTAKHGEDEHALCYLDLDQFKVINDTCGHTAGDELLRQLGQLLPGSVRKRDTLARLGGDEFGVLMEHCALPQALRAANSLRETVSEFRFIWDEQIFRVGVSIGLVPISGGNHSVEDVLSVADSACYAAKDQGRNRVQVYQADDTEFALRHSEMRWVARINQALEDDRFQLWSQPIVPITPGPGDGEHFELLLRMVDENGGCIPPGAFLPAAERYGLSTKLDRWVIKEAFAWLGRNPLMLERLELCSINLSGATLGDNELLQFVCDLLTTTKIPAEKICFEVTETAAISNMSRALKFMTDLRNLGCRFSLDDFGSGLSSFAYLKTLPVDFLKIDGMFVKDILDDNVDLALVRSINDVGKVMGNRTIAEFVESKAILEKLREIGVDYVQGYGVGRPAPIVDDAERDSATA